MNSIVITVDGPSASGKGTLSKQLAKSYDLYYLDTGLLYRSVGFIMLTKNLSLNDSREAEEVARNIDINNLPPDEEMRTEKIAKAASIIAAIPSVRNALIEIQRHIAYNPPENFHGAILDGRDIGTVVCKKADLKFYITADINIRAMRRMKELQISDFNNVLSDLETRDKLDKNRKYAPLSYPRDAIIIDTSHLTSHEVFVKASTYIENVLSRT